MTEQMYIYVDESGNTDLSEYSDDSKDYYVISAVLFPKEDVEFFSKSAKAIVSKHAGKGELKSSSIGNNTDRRIQILNDIADSRFSFYSLVVDKTRIYKNTGLRFKPSFYKFLHKMVYSQIRKTHFSLKLTLDRFGNTDFMVGFTNYIMKRIDLFEKVSFKPSSELPLLQIADVIAGSIRRVFMGNDNKDLLKIINYPSMPFEKWPPSQNSSYCEISFNQEEEFNHLIQNIAVKSAEEFVYNNLHSDIEDMRVKVECVRFLLYKYCENPKSYILRDEIRSHLLKTIGCEISSQMLSSKILAPIKDNDVLLASTDKGIKIPYDATDIREWVNRVNSQIVPYLKRLGVVRTQLLTATQSKYDIVSKELFPELADYLSYGNQPIINTPKLSDSNLKSSKM
ncbi:DUF3800 domain-containing protein [bacterium]|nr:DUF3800 domain-containing protein [bacterium]